MTAVIICEFNPFHNGHGYIVNEARKLVGNGGRIIAVMSGNFVQRGEPAVTHKWCRAKAALRCGIDAVIELPSVYAASGAQFFAEAAVNIINKLDFVDYIVFGSESGDIESIKKVAMLKANPTEQFNETLRDALSQGLAYPAAMQKALGFETTFLSNDILGIEYVTALIKSGGKAKPVAIKRTGTTSHSDDLPASGDGNITSANAIRTSLKRNEQSLTELQKYMPSEAFDEFSQSLKENGGPVCLNDFEQYIFGRILAIGPEGLKNLPFITEGLENKIYAECLNARKLEELIEGCVGKRYTRTRITRALTALITGADHEKHFSKGINLPYLRILGIKDSSKELLGKVARCCKEKGNDYIAGAVPPEFNGLSRQSAELLKLECIATDIYFLATPEKRAGAEFREGLVTEALATV